MQLSSPAFAHQGTIPAKYTCDGVNASPPLAISGVPPRADSLVLLVEDPDAPGGTFVHWVVYDIPPATEKIPENTAPGTMGINNFRQTAYGGPCPPSGTHRYYFRLYALDRKLDLSPGRSKKQVEQAMTGHVLAQAELMGRYARI